MAIRDWDVDDFWGPAALVLVTVGVLYGTLNLGEYLGRNQVLDSARMAAENEILYQMVTVQSTAPSPDMMAAANTVCEKETGSLFDDCMKEFLNGFGEVWVVNLVDGSRSLLSTRAIPTEELPK